MARWLSLMIAAYVALFSWFTWRRHMSFTEGEWDTGIFDQSFWTATQLGMPFYNTYEGISHFGFHNSPIFFLLWPIYKLWPSVMTLFVAQTAALALGAIPVYLLGRDLIGPRSGLLFAGLYLLYFPMHGVNYHEFHETGLVVAPLLLALWGMRTGRRVPMWLGIILALACREDIGVLVIGMGLLGLWWRRAASREDAPPHLRGCPAVADCYAMVAAGIAWSYVSFAVVLPHFRGGRSDVNLQADRLKHLGDGPLQWLLSPLLRPGAFWGALATKASLSYVLGLLAPLGFLPLWALPTLLVMAPVLVLNLVSSFGGMHLFSSHYAGPLIPFVFCAAVEGCAHLAWRHGGGLDAKPSALDDRALRLMRPAVFLTLALVLAFDPSPLHVGWKVRKIDAHARVLARFAGAVPPDASISTLPNIWPHVNHRLRAYPVFREGVDYVLTDRTTPQFVRESRLDVRLPQLVESGEYVLEREEDGVQLYRRR